MIILDYFVYKLSTLYLIRNKDNFKNKKIIPSLPGVTLFLLLLGLNFASILHLLGNPLNVVKANEYGIIFLVLSFIILAYIYDFKGRFKKVFEKYKNESRFWKVMGWVIIGFYFLITIVLMVMPFGYFKST